MNNEKVYIEGYVVGCFADTLENRGKQIQLINGDIVDIEDNFIYKSIEPEKVKIPQFVADWIEYFKKCSGTLYGSTAPYSYYGRAITDDFDGDVIEVLGWIRDNSEVYARAWIFGYEVDEKRYLVTIKGVVSNFKVLKHNINEDTWYMSNKINYTDLKAYHTKKELEDAAFGWVFDCEGIEIEEVTE